VHGLWYEELRSLILVVCGENAASKARDMLEGIQRWNEDKLVNDLEKQQT
jgi:hypothetical protein